MIKGLNLRLLGNPPPALIAQRMHEIKALGADSVALVTHHYCYLDPGTPNLAPPPVEWGPLNVSGKPWLIFPDIGQDRAHPYANTPSYDTVYYAVAAAKSAGLNIWLKPHLDSHYGAWRGWIVVPRPLAYDFEWSYRHRFLMPYASIAHEYGCGLVLGTELLQVTRDLGAQFWIENARWLRKFGFAGPLTYAANHGEEVEILGDLWSVPEITHIGCDAYYPLPVSAPSGWYMPAGSSPANVLGGIAVATGKQVLLTEVGYQNAVGAAAQPWGVECGGAKRDNAEQFTLALALVGGVAREQWCAGYLWWEAPRLTSGSFQDECEQKDISHVPTGETATVLFGNA